MYFIIYLLFNFHFFKRKKKSNKNKDLDFLKAGISNNANLLSDDELGELFGGYCKADYCHSGYEDAISGKKCKSDYCPAIYY